MDEIILHVTQIVNTEELQLYTLVYPRNMVCFRYIIANTLREGDDDDDNNVHNNNNGVKCDN